MQTTPAPSSPPTAWHTLSRSLVAAQLHVTDAGLATAEAARRLAEHGPNELLAAHRISPWAILAEQLKNILIIILFVAIILSAVLGHSVEAIAIAVILIFAVLLGFFQEYRAERAIDALRQMAAPNATVIRDGAEHQIPARDLVPGDVILLKAGDRVPADARLLESVNLKVEEAALTGESVAVEKRTDTLNDAELALGDRVNLAYAGTIVTYGRGRGMVVATGMSTEFGKIARMLATVETSRTPLQVNLDKVGKALAWAGGAVVLVIVALGLARGQDFVEMLIFGIALAVAVVPEALPAVVTISLAIGVQRMVRRNALIRRLAAVETLGSTSVICSDKTGTLTKDEMTVRQFFVAGRLLEVTGAGYEPKGAFLLNGAEIKPTESLAKLLVSATLCCDAKVQRDEKDGSWTVKGDPTEGALVVAAAKAGINKGELDRRSVRVHEIPFTSETKRMTTLHKTGDVVESHAKGAAEIILDSCTKLLSERDGQLTEIPLDAAARQTILDAAQQMAGSALRVLGIANRSNATPENAEKEMTFLGLVGMIDPPRPEAKAAIQTCFDAGIKVVMITGDHPITAQAIARELGLLRGGKAVTGADVEAMSEEQFDKEVESIEVYARVSPAHKLRVVTALQKQGRVVAMTGDGVNDAPALKKADIGIAMGITGTDVTKEVAAMTLTDDNFASIVAAVEEGRGIFSNIKKYLMYLLSSNIGEILLMAGAAILGLPMPLTAVQILYVNLATDGLPALALAVDPPEPGLMKRNPRDPHVGIFTRAVVTLIVVGGAWSAFINLTVFGWALDQGGDIEHAMTLCFVTLVLVQFFKAYNFRSDRHTVLRKPFANKWLNLAVLWEMVLLIAIVYLPVLHEPFGTRNLTATDWAISIGLALTVMPVLELAKWMERRGWFGKLA